MLHGEESQERDALPQGGPTGYRAVGTVEGDAAEQPKCEHRKRIAGTTRARHQHDASPLVYPAKTHPRTAGDPQEVLRETH